MRLLERRAPRLPAAALDQARLDPFGQLRRTLDRLRGELAEALAGQPFRERINRFALGQFMRFIGRKQMVRVDDLELLAVAFELARDDAHLPQRQQLLRPAGIASEIDEADIVASRVGRVHAKGRAAAPALAIVDRLERYGDHLAHVRHVQPFDAAAVDEARRQMERDVHGARQPQPFERPGDPRPDAFQRGHLGEQRIEYLGPHARSLAARTATRRCRNPRHSCSIRPRSCHARDRNRWR